MTGKKREDFYIKRENPKITSGWLNLYTSQDSFTNTKDADLGLLQMLNYKYKHIRMNGQSKIYVCHEINTWVW